MAKETVEFFQVYLPLTFAFLQAIINLHYCVHEMLTGVKISAKDAKRSIVVQADVTKTFSMSQAKCFVSSLKIGVCV